LKRVDSFSRSASSPIV